MSLLSAVNSNANFMQILCKFYANQEATEGGGINLIRLQFIMQNNAIRLNLINLIALVWLELNSVRIKQVCTLRANNCSLTMRWLHAALAAQLRCWLIKSLFSTQTLRSHVPRCLLHFPSFLMSVVVCFYPRSHQPLESDLIQLYSWNLSE